jgi:hypothetical protein
VSRQLVGAVEAGRHSPNVDAALRMARSLGVSVEVLFDVHEPAAVAVIGPEVGSPQLATTVRVGETIVAVPLAHGTVGGESWGLADAVVEGGHPRWLSQSSTDGLVIAGCDPVLGLAARLVERASAHRVVTVHASTGRSLEALTDGRVHGTLVHAPIGELPQPPVPVRRWHVARWQVGLASRRRGGPPTVEELAERRSQVVQRDRGAGSQLALLRALAAVGAGALPGPVAEGHVDVARRVAHGSGRAGITMEAAAGAFDLSFAPLEEHTVELWLDVRWATLPAAVSLVELLGSEPLMQRVALLPGYDLAGSGTERMAG